jgi:predicted transposase YdaD
MFQLPDLRDTRVYQEAKEEGQKEGIKMAIEKGIEIGIEFERQRNFQEKLRFIVKLVARKMSADDIADLLGLDVDLVRKEMAKYQ